LVTDYTPVKYKIVAKLTALWRSAFLCKNTIQTYYTAEKTKSKTKPTFRLSELCSEFKKVGY